MVNTIIKELEVNDLIIIVILILVFYNLSK